MFHTHRYAAKRKLIYIISSVSLVAKSACCLFVVVVSLNNKQYEEQGTSNANTSYELV
jgi:hypothetical protein